MLAYGAYFRSFFANHDVAAVAADPDCIVIAGKYYAVLDVGQQTAITLFVVAFDGCYGPETPCNFLEALLFGLASHTLVHVGPFEILAIGSILQICHSVGNLASVEIFEPELGVLFLVCSGLFEEGSDLLVAVLASFRRIISILIACLRWLPSGCVRSLFLLVCSCCKVLFELLGEYIDYLSVL